MALQVVVKPSQQSAHSHNHPHHPQQQAQSHAASTSTTTAAHRHALPKRSALSATTSTTPALVHRARFAAVLREVAAAAEQMRVRRARRPSPPRTVFLLDWDDTCCATSYLERCGVMADLDTRVEEFAPQLARYLRLLEQRVLTLLKTAARLGTVMIVTNAGDGWVELSSSRFLPAVSAFLQRHERDIKIVSARARYVHAFRTQPLQWKALTFADELRPLLLRSQQVPPTTTTSAREPLHVVVLGDSIGDQYAAHAAAGTLTAEGHALVLKVVKFLERPTIDQLCKELAVVLDHIYAMTVHASSFDVSMYKDVGAASPAAAAAAAHQQQQHLSQQQALHQHHHKVAAAQHHPHHLTAQDMAAAQAHEAPAADAALGAVAPMATCAAAV